MSKKAKRRQKQKQKRESGLEKVFFDAAASGDIDTVRQCIEEQGQKVDAKKAASELHPECMTPLLLACKHGRLKMVKFLVEDASADSDATDTNGCTALMIACLCGYRDIASFLLDNGSANAVHARASADGKTALMFACERGHAAIARLLVEKGADVNAGDERGSTALIAASIMGHLDTVKFLVEDAGADVNVTDADGDSALAQSGGNGHEDVASFLLAHGATKDFFVSALLGDLEAVTKAVEEDGQVGRQSGPCRACHSPLS